MSEDLLRYTPMVMLPIILFVAVLLGLQVRTLSADTQELTEQVETLQGKVMRMQQAGAVRGVQPAPSPRGGKAKGGKAKGGKAKGGKAKEGKAKEGKAKGGKNKGGKAKEGKAKGGKTRPNDPPQEG